jgi:hypothetical protein
MLELGGLRWEERKVDGIQSILHNDDLLVTVAVTASLNGEVEQCTAQRPVCTISEMKRESRLHDIYAVYECRSIGIC